jgi:hypothetical protein
VEASIKDIQQKNEYPSCEGTPSSTGSKTMHNVSPPEVMSLSGGIGYRTRSVRKEIGPRSLGLSVLINSEDTVEASEIHV